MYVPNIKHLPSIELVDEGMVKRVRGISYSMRTTPQNSNRIVDVSAVPGLVDAGALTARRPRCLAPSLQSHGHLTIPLKDFLAE